MKIYLLFIGLLLFAACGRTEQRGNPEELFAADESFSQMSQQMGLNTAFIFYAADSVVKLRDGNFPIVGKNELARIYRAMPDSGMILLWTPLRAEVAASNDLGYTFGEWELRIKAKDTTLYGNYVSIWKRQADGNWKYVLDAGTSTPKPNQ